MLRHLNKKIDYDNFEIKMNGKSLYPSKFVEYSGVIIDAHLNFSIHINSVYSDRHVSQNQTSCNERHSSLNILVYFHQYIHMVAKFGDKIIISFD